MSGKDAASFRGFVEALDRVDRLVLMMWYIDGLSPTEIGAVLGWSDMKVAESITRLRRDASEAISFIKPDPAAETKIPA